MLRVPTFVNGPVPTLDSLPLKDPIGSIRYVSSEGKNYICVSEDLDVRTQWREYSGGEIQPPIFD